MTFASVGEFPFVVPLYAAVLLAFFAFSFLDIRKPRRRRFNFRVRGLQSPRAALAIPACGVFHPLMGRFSTLCEEVSFALFPNGFFSERP